MRLRRRRGAARPGRLIPEPTPLHGDVPIRVDVLIGWQLWRQATPASGGNASISLPISPNPAPYACISDFNVAQIHEDDTAKLERIGRCLRADHALHVVIEGNADERGTEEWNLALGDKRATAVETYLERLGASAAQLKTVTYGKDRPLCSEHNESCWAKNRRAEVKPKEARRWTKTAG